MAQTIQVNDFDTRISISYIEQTFGANSNIPPKLLEYNALAIGAGRGYNSHVIKLDLKWSADEINLPNSVVLKIPKERELSEFDCVAQFPEVTFDASNPSEAIKQWQILGSRKFHAHFQGHFAECAFYHFVNENAWEQLRLPKCWAANRSVLILEDFSTCHSIEFHQGLSLKQCLQIAEALAALHGYCIKDPSWISNRDLLTPGELMRKSVRQFLLAGLETHTKTAETEWPSDMQGLARRIPEIASSLEDLRFVEQINEEFSVPAVLVHGDFHVQNMVFGANENDVLKAIFDWQGVHCGNVAEDLGVLLSFSIDSNIGEEEIKVILEHYYNSLKSQLAPNTVPFEFETFEKVVSRMTRYSTFLVVAALVTFTRLENISGENKQDKGKIFLARAQRLLKKCFDLIDAGNT